MRVGEFSLQVEGKNHSPEGYVQMVHREQYSLRLSSFTDRRTDVTIEIDGEDVGTWRLDPRARFVLERGAYDNGKFTFFLADSSESRKANLTAVPTDKLGLITATFRPEVIRPSYNLVRPMRSIGMKSLSVGSNFAAGGTGLTGESKQQFQTVESVRYDDALTTVINLRLVGIRNADDEVRPKVTDIRRNPVPPPVC